MKTLRTSPKLLAALAGAASTKMTAAQLFEQRVSFVYGQTHYDKPTIRAVLRSSTGESK